MQLRRLLLPGVSHLFCLSDQRGYIRLHRRHDYWAPQDIDWHFAWGFTLVFVGMMTSWGPWSTAYILTPAA